MLPRWWKGVKQFRYQKMIVLEDIRKQPDKMKRLVSIMKAQDPVQSDMFSYHLYRPNQYLLHYQSNTQVSSLFATALKFAWLLQGHFRAFSERRSWVVHLTNPVFSNSTSWSVSVQHRRGTRNSVSVGGRDHLVGAKGETEAVNSKINYQGTVASIV